MKRVSSVASIMEIRTEASQKFKIETAMQFLGIYSKTVSDYRNTYGTKFQVRDC